ncbi:hypothetical protein [Herbiconiux sp. YIM B11900]|uniref:hypothetical protein n=1 Tax=Herbiconiux sp. YIM B11900 TaxID=3404131 RepID=UPI003F85B5E9
MTFPNDFWMHPKVAPLSVEAKWAFVEMNGYSRMQDLDGRIPEVMAHRLWDPATLALLVSSHPEKPLVVVSDGAYVIRDYAQHQQTTDAREKLSQARSEAGRAGRAKQLAGKGQTPAGQESGQVPGQSWAESESETELETKRSPSNEGDPSLSEPDGSDSGFSADVHRLCDLLADLIRLNGNKVGTVGKVWWTACDRLVRIDGYTPQQVEWVMRWSQANEFWQGNVLSMPKLREKFDQLKTRAMAEAASKTASAAPRQTAARRNLGTVAHFQEKKRLELDQ